MGGRGSASSMGGRGSSSNIGETLMSIDTKFTTKEINSMTRSQLETVARAVFIKQNPKLTAAEADYRARSLLSGNSNSQLKSYIKKYG